MKKIRPTRILEGTLKNIIGNQTQASTERIKICKRCDKLKKGLCTICGCVVSAKTKVFEEYCPMQKWNDIKVLKKAGVAIAIKNPEKATLTVDEEDYNFIFNYGQIKKGTDTKLKLVMVNDRGNYFTENQDLTKINIRTTCSCTVSNFKQKELKEGASADFELSYDSSRIGVFSKKVEFSTKETAFKITLKGEVTE